MRPDPTTKDYFFNLCETNKDVPFILVCDIPKADMFTWFFFQEKVCYFKDQFIAYKNPEEIQKAWEHIKKGEQR